MIYKLYETVVIKATGEKAVIVDNPKTEDGSYLLEVIGKNEMPDFYYKDDFEVVKE